MEDLKLAFETVVVGLLAIPWVLVFAHIIFYALTGKSLFTQIRAFLTNSEQPLSLIAPLILGLAFCAGTIIFPLADEYFNSAWRFPISVKDDDAIRIKTLISGYCSYKDGGPQANYYELRAEDFPGLPEAGKNIEIINQAKLEAAKIYKDENELEEVNESLYKKLKDPVHRIYNYQKFYDYNSEKGYDILKPLKSQIVVLRGAVCNGLILLGALVTLFLFVLPETFLSRSREKILVWRWSRQKFLSLFIVSIIGVLVWALCWLGSWGVARSEEEYDKYVVGLFYAAKSVKSDVQDKQAGEGQAEATGAEQKAEGKKTDQKQDAPDAKSQPKEPNK